MGEVKVFSVFLPDGGTCPAPLYFRLAVGVMRGRYRGRPGIRYRAARLRLYLQYRLLMTCSRFISFAYLTCGRLIKLRLAYILCYFIR